MHGTITVIDKGPVRIHRYTAPEDGLNVNTQLIETPSRIIAVDAQFALAYADEVVAYAKQLGKPIDRLVISHAHPDHYQGAARFGAPCTRCQRPPRRSSPWATRPTCPPAPRSRSPT